MVSILSLPVSQPGNTQGVDPSRIHVLAGPTKTFGASGIKVGALVSQYNPTIIKMLGAALNATPISSAADALFTSVLMDGRDEGPTGVEESSGLGTFARWFLDENVKRLTKAFELVARWCNFHGIK